MKIVLAALNAKYVHSNLAVYDIEAYTRKNWINEYGTEDGLLLVVKEYTINHNLDRIMQSIYKENADFIAFSCYIWNISEILIICKELKKVSPGLSIWLGGPEVSYDSEKFLDKNEYIDGVIQGEGEATFFELIKNYKDKLYSHESVREIELYKCLEMVKGIVYKNPEGKIIRNSQRPLILMDDIPFIYTDLKRFENKILYYESSRGCPYSCSYCLSSIDKRVRFRNLSMVKNELKFFMDNRVRQVKLIDRTFNCDRKRAREIWGYLTDNDNGVTNFHFEIAADLIESEDLEIFRKMRPGLIQLEIGLQSTNGSTIQEIRRVMDIEKLKHNMLEIRKMGNIHQHLDLIAGLPYEDYESFVRSFNDAYAMKPNQLQLGFLKVLKGSYMEERVKEYGLLYKDEQPYEVLSTKWISYGEILKLKQVEEMVEIYYNSDQFEHVLPYVETYFETPFEMFEKLGQYYDENNLFGLGFKREMRYIILKDFFEKCIKPMDKEFESLLTFDYYLRENAKSRPSWRSRQLIEKDDYNSFFKNGGTEELLLKKRGYDSKSAANSMHIEPMSKESIKWICIDGVKKKVDNDSEIMYAIFDYTDKNAITGDATFYIISHI